jgi:hypothetical protein
MAKRQRVFGLDDYRLTVKALTRLGQRPVRLSIQLTGRTTASLLHVRPKQRDALLRETLTRQLSRLRRDFPTIDFVSRDTRKASWQIDAVVPAARVYDLARRRDVRDVWVNDIEGRRKRPRKMGLSWFCVWGVVAIQVEGNTGSLNLEDRFVLVKARFAEDAQKRLERMWAGYAEPYLNPHGYLVRWQLIAIRGVYDLFEDTIDPRGTEVYSRLRRVRMRPEFLWRPERTRKRSGRTS